MPLNYSFSGKKVLITGGGQGIGRTLVQKFHEDGAKVFTLDKNSEAIQKLRKELPGVRAEVVDLTDWAATRKLVESFGPIDHLVNNAGVVEVIKFMEVTKESAHLHFNVNVVAAVNVTQAVARVAIQEGREATVVNMASVAGRIANPVGVSMYAASKAALENLTKSMALELGPHKIRVNCILPGVVDAPMVQENSDAVKDLVKNMLAQRLIVKRPVDPAEIADMAMFLLSPLAAMIAGQGVVVDGGWLTN